MKTIKSDKEYFDIINNSKEIPILVLFSTTWCGPCKRLKPLVEELAKEQGEEKLQVLLVDCEDQEQVAHEESIKAFPTMLLYQNGKQIKEQKGFINKVKLKEFIDTTPETITVKPQSCEKPS